MKKYRILSLCLALTLVVLSVPLVVSKANDVDTNTITEYVDNDGDGYVDVDSIYSDFPVTSQTVTDEGIVVTCYDVPQMFATEPQNWYYDSIIIDYSLSSGFDAIIKGPFSGSFSISIPSSANTSYAYVYFINDFINGGMHDYSSFDILPTINIYSEDIGTFQYGRYYQNLTSSPYRTSSGTLTLSDNLYTYSIKQTLSHTSTYTGLISMVTFNSSNSQTVVVDIVCGCDVTLYGSDGFEVEVDSRQ